MIDRCAGIFFLSRSVTITLPAYANKRSNQNDIRLQLFVDSFDRTSNGAHELLSSHFHACSS